MNTIDDLRGEFSVLAGGAPGDDAIRAAFEVRLAQREKRRRTRALVAVAAAVVLVAGGIGITSAMLRSAPSSTRPASIPPVVPVPGFPLPADTQLIRYQLQPVSSPVTAAAPDGLGGLTWMQSPGRLAVSFFDLASATGEMAVTSGGSPGRTSAGYVITDAADDPVQTAGPDGVTTAQVSRRAVAVGDHDATLESAPSDALDATGFPAAERLAWQLPDGRYIHVWATGLPTRDSSPDSALMDFAESITDTPQTLPRALGIGLTLPGLTVASSMNIPVVGGFTPEYLMMCAPGVDPFIATGGSSGTGGASGGAVPEESMSIEPGAPETSVTTGGSPAERCLTVAVANGATAHPGVSESAEMTVADTTVTVVSSSGGSGAMADLGNGLTAIVAAPASTNLSDGDLAALAASVRLSPSVEVIPLDLSGSQGSGEASAWGSASAVASSSAAPVSGSSSDPAAPTGENAIKVDRDADVVASVGSDGASAAVQFTVQNPGAQPRNLTRMSLEVPGMTQIGMKARLDNTPDDAGAAFQDAVLPAMLAPGTRVRILVEFRVDQCSAVTGNAPVLNAEWQAESSGGGFSESLPVTDPAGGLEELLSSFCP